MRKLKSKSTDFFILTMNREMYHEIEKFIDASCCVKFSFLDLGKRAAGFSTPNECVVSTSIFQLPLEYMLYILLHEVSHQYQYKKYGKNLCLDIYKSEISLDEAVSKLLHIESVADRLALAKMKFILKTCNVPLQIDPIPRYLGNTNYEYFKKYISDIRENVNLLNLETIEEINAYIYASIIDN
jgi:hypothetical protein